MHGGARAIYSRGCCGAGSRARRLYECIYYRGRGCTCNRVSTVYYSRGCVCSTLYTFAVVASVIIILYYIAVIRNATAVASDNNRSPIGYW